MILLKTRLQQRFKILSLTFILVFTLLTPYVEAASVYSQVNYQTTHTVPSSNLGSNGYVLYELIAEPGSTITDFSLTVSSDQGGGSGTLEWRRLYVDFDFSCPNIAKFFRIKDVVGVEVMSNQPFSPGLADELMYKIKDNLTVFPGVMDSRYHEYKDEDINKLLNYLLNKFDVVIIDTEPGFYKPMYLDLFARADIVLPVLNHIHYNQGATCLLSSTLVVMGTDPKKMHLVINKYTNEGPDVKDIETQFSGCLNAQKCSDVPRVIVKIPYYLGGDLGIKESFKVLSDLL